MSATASSNTSGAVLGASTTATGIALLPNTGPSTISEYMSYLAIFLGTVILTSAFLRIVLLRIKRSR